MDALEVIEKEIKGITKKESITPAELANLKEALLNIARGEGGS